MSTIVARRPSRIVEGTCWTCRRRRVKCDLEKPACRRCQQNDQVCNYGAVAPFKWIGGAASRGKNAPADPPKTAPSTEAGESILMSPNDSARLDTECMLLYFSQAVLPRFHLQEDVPPLDLSLIMHDKPLKQAILAVSQTHFDLAHVITTNVSNTRKQARCTAIKSLRNQLEIGVESNATAQNLFIINVLLCMLDGMIEPSDEQPGATKWHLQGGHAMLNRWSSMPTDLIAKNGLHTHLLSCFATMDLVHALLSGDKPFFDPMIWYMFAGSHTWWGTLPCDDRFLGLLKSFSELASLGHLVASRLPADDGVRLAQKCLPSMEASLFDKPLQSEAFTGDDFMSPQNWATFCDLYEISGIIYIQRALRLCPVDDEVVQTATREGVAKLINDALPGMMAHCIILPLLVIGAHTLSSDDHQAITQALTPSISYLSFGNVQLMLDLLKDIWKTADMSLTWWESFHAISEKAFLF